MTEILKFVYEDDKKTKIVRGRILKDTEHLYEIEDIITKRTIFLGKRTIIRIYPAEVEQ